MVPKTLAVTVLGALLWSCGGADVPGSAAADVDPAEFAAQADTTTAEPVQLIREQFSYSSGGRDPFTSLVSSTTNNLRPLPEDLRVLSILYDAAYPTRSVAVVRDTTVDARYELRVNDRIGRMLVSEIRSTEVVFTVENFGVPEQVVLAIRRRNQGEF